MDRIEIIVGSRFHIILPYTFEGIEIAEEAIEIAKRLLDIVKTELEGG